MERGKSVDYTYIINKNTLLLMSSDDKKKTIIYEDNNIYNCNMKFYKLINNNCKIYGNTYKNRIEYSSILLNTTIKLPIILEYENELILFPTHSARNDICMWVSFNNINKIIKIDKSNTKILFQNGVEIIVKCSYLILNNQINKCAKLKCILSDRKKALIV